MARLVRIHQGKTPPRIHYIAEWAALRQIKRSQIIKDLGVDKGTVSRWFNGSLPLEKHLIPLAELLAAPEPASLFRHPDDDWIARFFRERQADERERAIRMLDAAFPRRA